MIRSILCASLLAILLGDSIQADPPQADWTNWRGSDFSGNGYETGLPDRFDSEEGADSTLRWKRPDLGGRSTPVVMNGRLYTAVRSERETPREGEKVVCIDVATGKTIWENVFNVYLTDVPDTRIGWSSVVADPESQSIFVLGVCDLFLCIDANTGATRWKIPLHEQLGMLSTYGGRTNFPIVCDDLVIISGVLINWGDWARPNHRMIALDKKTGSFRWISGTRDLPEDTTYSAPTLRTIEGQKQLILGTGDGAIWGFQPRTGRPLWNYPFSRIGVQASPLVVGDMVYATHSEENVTGSAMGAVAAIRISGSGEQTSASEQWKIEEVMVGRSSPVLIDDQLYVVDDRNKLWVFDPKNGEEIVRQMKLADNKMWASLLHADGKLYIFTENGRWAIVEPKGEESSMIAKGTFPDGESFLASPIVAGGRMFVPGFNALYCFEDTTKPHATLPPPAEPEETAIGNNPEPAWLQVVPCESMLAPGQQQPLTVKLYNRLGQYLRDAKPSEVSFEATGPVAVKDGTLSVNADAAHDGAIITAKLGKLSGLSRARIVPPLPWKFDFDKAKDAPLSWVGARYRHIIKPIDGSPALVKVTTIPKGTRSRAWMGPSTLRDYTMIAEVKGQTVKNQQGIELPDIGLIAQGATLDMMGNSQKLEIRTWEPIQRCTKSIDFAWKGETWYVMKFQAQSRKQGDAMELVYRGKVWPKGTEEPKAWMVEAIDVAPVASGSPGLYGNAKVCEIYLDNITVAPNSAP
jgi:outer membrane protein assembly factor BamB